MINKLTQKQLDQIPAYRDKWLKIGLDTEPITLEYSRPIINDFYAILKKPSPQIILIMPNPIQAWTAVCLFCGQQVGQQVRQQVGQQVEQQVWQQVRQQVWQQVRHQVWQQVWQQVEQQVESFIWPQLDGNFMASWFAFYDFVFSQLIQCRCEYYTAWERTSRLSLIYPLDCGMCVLCQKAQNLYFLNNQLHNESGPSIVYGGDWNIYSLHGVCVPEWLVMTPENEIDPKRFSEIENAEVRREFIRKIGIDRIWYKNATVIEKSSNGVYELGTIEVVSGSPRKYLKMLNPSIETWHVEAVHPGCNTIQQAINYRRHGSIYVKKQDDWKPQILT